MRGLPYLFLAFISGGPVWSAAQPGVPKPPDQLPAIVMPVDRAEESYAIYSSLMPIGEIANPGWQHDLWLVEDTTTTVVPPERPCAQEPSEKDKDSIASTFDLRTAVMPDAARRQDFAEILEDYDRHCHERLLLDPGAWKTSVSVRLLNEKEQTEFMGVRAGATPNPALVAKYKGAPALFSFSEAFFNAHRTVAVVFVRQWCGGLCGQFFWQAVALEDGQWKKLNWTVVSAIS